MTPHQEFIVYLTCECLYKDVRTISPTHYAAIYPLMYTHSIIVGRVGDRMGYDNRWCYQTYEKAKAALEAWDGTAEPTGWHRHPDSGRRVDESGKEYVAI